MVTFTGCERGRDDEMGKPAAPKNYGRDFSREDMLEYHPMLSQRLYRLKRDRRWFIQSGKSAHSWQIFCDTPRIWGGAAGAHGTGWKSPPVAVAIGKPALTFRDARTRLLEGIRLGFYQVSDDEPL
jgi:hypothetical protein